jgi:colicin import membrane protein
MSGTSPYQVPRHPGRWRAIALAVIVHLALVAFLWIGISWQSKTPLAVEAEIWDPTIREAAPLPTPQPEPEPVRPAPQPEPAVATPPAPVTPPPPPVEQAAVVKPDIALEQEKEQRRKEREKQHELERQKEAKREKEKQLKLAKEQQEKADLLKKEQQDKADLLKKQKAEADKKLAKQKADADAKKKAEADKLAAEKKQKQDAADSKAADQRRQADLKRMMNQASSSAGGNGDAAKSQGPRGTPDYANKIAARIRSNTTFDIPSDLAGNPSVEYAVELFPDGSVRSVHLKKPSGVPGFDDAVARAINKSQPFPADKDGKVPNSISVIHKPKDNN